MEAIQPQLNSLLWVCRSPVLHFGEWSVWAGAFMLLVLLSSISLLLFLPLPLISRTSITQNPFYDLVSARKKKIASKN